MVWSKAENNYARVLAPAFKELRPQFGDLNLTVAQRRVLGYLLGNEGVCQVRLSQLAGTDPP